MHDALRVALAWQEAANNQDVEGLLALSDPQIEIVGPRGSAIGHAVLREWLDRAGASFVSYRTFAQDDRIVLAQNGVWRAKGTGEIIGERDVASVFRVAGGRVVQYARYDTIDEALAQADLNAADEIESGTA